ncbi:MAG: alpha-L-rhamnosidase [Ruminococcaceae bacterium]|nr:alpha-L-rhamnosidase [Oscillospiraceae bacterium]
MCDKECLKKVPYGIRKEEILKNTEKDNRVRRFMAPARVVWKTDSDKASVTGEEALFEARPKQIHFNPGQTCVLTSKGESAGILLDFGVEFHGYVKLYIHSVTPKRVKLRVRFGESVSEAMSEIGGDKNATNDHINRDQIIDVGFLSMPEIGPSGFRFVRIDLLDTDASVGFQAIQGIFTYRELEYKGSFECNDELLNQIWDTAAYTVHLNMQEYVWDGIKRDRLVWIGDIHPETSTIQAVFGYDESVEKSLDLARDESPLPAMMCGMSSYSLWWIMVQYGWYMQNGNKEFLQSQKAYLIDLLKFFAGCIKDNGEEDLPPTRFVDWPTQALPEATHAGLQGILSMTLATGAILCRELDDEETAEICEEAVKKLAKHIPDTHGNKQAAALLALAGIEDAKKLSDEVLKVGGAKGFSTFLGYYMLCAMGKAGDVDDALDIIKEYWGAMLSRGATTFWEDFNMDWLEGSSRIDELVPEGVKDIHGDYGAYCYKGFRHSLCHGWASGPAAFMSEYVLGIKPVAAGCEKIEFKPNLGKLSWAKGTYPTPKGIIKVELSRNADGSVATKIDLPEGVSIAE